MAIVIATAVGGCGQRADVGSDLLWVARHEGVSFDEWTENDGGAVQAFPAPNIVEISTERAHAGGHAAKLTLSATAGSSRQTAALVRSGGLPVEAYYSAWYYLPRTVDIGAYWVIFKFRMRSSADDPMSVGELYDLDLANLPTGEMTLRLYDHRTGDVPLDVPDPVVSVGTWFQVEAYYRNTFDNTGRVTFFLNGASIVDIARHPMAPTPWVEWQACSIGDALNPAQAVLFIDDAAISRTRVGPNGILAD